MKAKLFESRDRKEIRLENGTQYFAGPEEITIDFMSRVTIEVLGTFLEDLEIEILDLKKLKKKGSQQLLKSLERLIGVEADMVIELLQDRGFGIPEEPNFEAEREDIEQELAEESKFVVKTKNSKPLSTEEYRALAKAARIDIGKTCIFKPSRASDDKTGTIAGIMVDKRVNRVYYRITVEKKVYHKRVDSDDIFIQ